MQQPLETVGKDSFETEITCHLERQIHFRLMMEPSHKCPFLKMNSKSPDIFMIKIYDENIVSKL